MIPGALGALEMKHGDLEMKPGELGAQAMTPLEPGVLEMELGEPGALEMDHGEPGAQAMTPLEPGVLEMEPLELVDQEVLQSDLKPLFLHVKIIGRAKNV